MAGGKETPRQKMIGMMYLVLTALLAMNVSKSILDAFVTINEGLEVTNSNFINKNQNTYNDFEKAMMVDPEKVKDYRDAAFTAKNHADALDQHIKDLKSHIIHKTTGLPKEVADTIKLRNVESKDNYDVPTNIMIGEPANPKPATEPWTALELKDKIKKYHQSLLNLLPPEVQKTMNLGPNVDQTFNENDVQVEWEISKFYHSPLAAVVTALTKIQADIRNSEADVINALYSNISAKDFKFDTLAAKVIPNTNYLILGDTYRADVFVAAFSKTQAPEMEVGHELDSSGAIIGKKDSTGISYDRGVAKYKFKPQKEGIVEWGGVIKIKKPSGEWSPYKFRETFTVAKPTLVVSPTKMNVFYRGLDNPVDVSVPGVPTDKLQVNISNARLSGSNGTYEVKPGNGAKCEVSVSADINGKKQNFGSKEFRVKNVPSPVAEFAGKSGGNIPKKNVLASQGVRAVMQDFVYDLTWKIVSFKMSSTVRGNVVTLEARNAYVTPDMKQLLGSLVSGQKLYIEDIKAKGPDGSVRELGTIALKVI